MIIVLSGTLEGREINSLLALKGYEVQSVTAVDHGKGGLEKVINNQAVRMVIDTSHPSLEGISRLAKELCRNNNIEYIRFVREEVDLPESPLLFPVYSWEDAVQKAAKLGNTIFLTTGSYNLEVFLQHPDIVGKRVVVRVLPDYRVIERVQALGIVPKDIVAMQGPFSKDMNRVTFKMYNAAVIVTKDSGKVGGTDSKISAALSLNIPVVIIRRPRLKAKELDTVHTYEQVLEKVTIK